MSPLVIVIVVAMFAVPWAIGASRIALWLGDAPATLRRWSINRRLRGNRADLRRALRRPS